MTRRHLVADLWVLDVDPLRFEEPLRTALRRGIDESGATVLGELFHQFEPHGVSGCFLLAESHVSYHSFVEDKLLSLDVYTCGDADVERILEACRRVLSPVREQVRDVPRG